MASHPMKTPRLQSAITARIPKQTLALFAFWTSVLVPAIAMACPVCAQNEAGGVGRKVALGLFIFLPFVVVGTILFILRSAIRAEQRSFGKRSEA